MIKNDKKFKKITICFFTMISIISYSKDVISSKKEIIEKFTENSKNIRSMDVVVENTTTNKKKEKVLNNEYLNLLFSIVIETFTSFLS